MENTNCMQGTLQYNYGYYIMCVMHLEHVLLLKGLKVTSFITEWPTNVPLRQLIEVLSEQSIIFHALCDPKAYIQGFINRLPQRKAIIICKTDSLKC